MRPWIVAPSEPLPHLDIETLDPGIRRLVSLLREAGFDTCDSGDGVTKVNAAMRNEYPEDYHYVMSGTGILDVPNVAIRCHRESVIVEAEAVHGLLVLSTRPGTMSREDVAVEASYSPIDRTALVVVRGVSDADLKSGVAVHRSTR